MPKRKELRESAQNSARSSSSSSSRSLHKADLPSSVFHLQILGGRYIVVVVVGSLSILNASK